MRHLTVCRSIRTPHVKIVFGRSFMALQEDMFNLIGIKRFHLVDEGIMGAIVFTMRCLIAFTEKPHESAVLKDSLCEQEVGGSSSDPKRRMTYIPRERETAEQRLLEDYFGNDEFEPKYPEEKFRRRVRGANNDLNVLYGSPLFDDELVDTAPECPFVVNGHTYRKCYYLADGVYLAWSTFVKTFPVARDEKSLKFKRVQEAARKDIKRAFGVLQ
ncbi:reverse transcriptase domain-containing protein, partial [Tanacetum coccineum]